LDNGRKPDPALLRESVANQSYTCFLMNKGRINFERLFYWGRIKKTVPKE